MINLTLEGYEKYYRQLFLISGEQEAIAKTNCVVAFRMT